MSKIVDIYAKRRNALFMRTVYMVCEGLFLSAMLPFARGGKISIRFLQTQFARFEAVETDKSTGEIGHQRITAPLRHGLHIRLRP